MIGIICGTGFADPGFLLGQRDIEIETSYGMVHAIEGERFVYISRHDGGTVPAHRINHKANISAFKNMGVKQVIGVSSVGSLKADIPPGSLVVPHDFIQLSSVPTFFDEEVVHVTPELDESLRERIIKTAEGLGIDVITEGVYFQNRGPRLETRAEIRFLKDYADVVGMTMASEATLACETGIGYASLNMVDNFAHGLGSEKPEYEKIKEHAAKNTSVKSILRAMI